MKKNKMSLTTELDLTREGTAEMTRWCILIALHQSFGVGAARLNKILARAEKLGQESLDVAMTVNERGMPSTDRSLALRCSWMPEGVDPDFRVPVLHSPRTRRQEQLRMAGNVAASMVWTLCAKACMDELGFGNCTNTGACQAECPKAISIAHIARLNREFLSAKFED